MTLNNYTNEEYINLIAFCEINTVYGILGKEIGEQSKQDPKIQKKIA